MHSADEILKEYLRRKGPKTQPLPFFDTFEELLTHPDGVGLTTATKLQRAIARVIEGRELGPLWDDPTVRRAFGDVLPCQKKWRFRELLILAAIRAGKSLITAAAAIWFSQKVDLSVGVRDGEIPRFSIVSLEKDNARVNHTHVLAALRRPRLAHLRVEDPPENWREIIDETEAETLGAEFVWHPSGWPIEIRVVAGKRAGGSLISRWSAGCVLDEAPRMVGTAEGVINYTDMRRAVIARVLPGAMLFSVGSPWQAFGPVYEAVQNEFGYSPRPIPTRCIIKARGPDMNPMLWTPTHCEEIRHTDPDSYRTDVEGEFLDPDENLLPSSVIAACTRREPAVIPFERGHEYVAAMDPATRANAWTLVVMDRVGNKRRIVCAKQWVPAPDTPLRPRAVLEEVAFTLKQYGLRWVYTDQYAIDALEDLADLFGISLEMVTWTSNTRTSGFLHLATLYADSMMEHPDDPVLKKDLQLIKKRPSTKGVMIHLPGTPDKRHCDYAPAIALAAMHWLDDIVKDGPAPGTPEAYEAWEHECIERESAELQNVNWWAKTPFTEN